MMYIGHFISFIIFIQVNKIFCLLTFGNVFPIPSTLENDDPNFPQCPEENGAYRYTTNCSRFHLCSINTHTIYSCIDGFFFNPISGKCEIWIHEKQDIICEDVFKTINNKHYSNVLPQKESIQSYDYFNYRKSVTSQCSQPGIYPDILDCSLFHYCHLNKYHEILKCPNGLNFDPKTLLCSPTQLVNCQYEPPAPTIDDISIIELDSICHHYVPGTYLPVANIFDEFLICGTDGKPIRKKCKPGFHYNALIANCEMKACTKDPTICQNNGQCIDEFGSEKGFRCECLVEYEGEYCEMSANSTPLETTSTDINLSEKVISYIDPKSQDNIVFVEKKPTLNSPLSRVVNYFKSNNNQRRETNDIVKIITISILTFIILILITSILFGIFMFIRLILFRSINRTGLWNTLVEETAV